MCFLCHLVQWFAMGLLSLPGGTVEACGGIFVFTVICDSARDARLHVMRGAASLREKLTSLNSNLGVSNSGDHS